MEEAYREDEGMNLIVDANIVISALLKDSTARRILLHPSFDFYAPDFLFEEIEENITLIPKKSRLPRKELPKLIDLLKETVSSIPFDIYQDKLQEAHEIIGSIDEEDIPYIALSLAIPNEGILTEDKHFLRQKKVRIVKIKELLKHIT
ncbi:MAG: PIN domain-containing protein [Candidatus Hydrothermarchaeales archaeon]